MGPKKFPSKKLPPKKSPPMPTRRSERLAGKPKPSYTTTLMSTRPRKRLVATQKSPPKIWYTYKPEEIPFSYCHPPRASPGGHIHSNVSVNMPDWFALKLPRPIFDIAEAESKELGERLTPCIFFDTDDSDDTNDSDLEESDDTYDSDESEDPIDLAQSPPLPPIIHSYPLLPPTPPKICGKPLEEVKKLITPAFGPRDLTLPIQAEINPISPPSQAVLDEPVNVSSPSREVPQAILFPPSWDFTTLQPFSPPKNPQATERNFFSDAPQPLTLPPSPIPQLNRSPPVLVPADTDIDSDTLPYVETAESDLSEDESAANLEAADSSMDIIVLSSDSEEEIVELSTQNQDKSTTLKEPLPTSAPPLLQDSEVSSQSPSQSPPPTETDNLPKTVMGLLPKPNIPRMGNTFNKEYHDFYKNKINHHIFRHTLTPTQRTLRPQLPLPPPWTRQRTPLRFPPPPPPPFLHYPSFQRPIFPPGPPIFRPCPLPPRYPSFPQRIFRPHPYRRF